METEIKKINKHKAEFGSSTKSNKFLELADVFLSEHPEILFWTEPNDSKKGLFYVYKDGIYSQRSVFEIENLLLKFEPKDAYVCLPKALSDAKFQEVIRLIKRRRFFYRDMFNQENIINFKNGLLNINTGELMPHTMDIISTIQLPYNYDPDAKCPIFMRVLNESLDEDLEKIGIFQEFIGYCLTKSTKYERAMFLIGEAGTGKSTVLDAVEAILGEENCSSVRLDMLADPRFTGNLIDKYANIDNEIPQDIHNYEDALKKIISGQKITVNTKFIPTYDTKTFCKLIFAANDFPRINDTSKAVYRRMLLLDFNNVVDRNKIDVNLKYKIKSECSGIFNWAFEGLKRLRKNGEFTTSQDMVGRINELRLLNNSVYYFIDENFEVTGKDEDYIEISQLWEEYKDFCQKVGAKGIFKKNMFGKELKKVYSKEINTIRKTLCGAQCRVWSGLRKKTYIEKDDKLQWED